MDGDRQMYGDDRRVQAFVTARDSKRPRERLLRLMSRYARFVARDLRRRGYRITDGPLIETGEPGDYFIRDLVQVRITYDVEQDHAGTA